MSPLKGFRSWLNRPSLLGRFSPWSEDLYNQPFFESQVKGAVRYRQVQPQPLSPTDYLSDADPPLPSRRLPQAPVPESDVGQRQLTSLNGDENAKPQNGDKGLSSSPAMMPLAIRARESAPTVVSLFLDQAKGYLRQGVWEKAIAACKKAIAIDPQRSEAHRLMGKTLQAMGQPLEAMGYYADALILQPQSIETYTDLGGLYSHCQEWEQAITYYQQALNLAANSDMSISRAVLRDAQEGLTFAHVQAQRQANKINQAVDDLYQSLSLSPETFTAEEHCEMGQLLLQQGDGDSAMECFQRAIDCQPSCVDAHLQLAILLEQRQQWQESTFHYKQAVQGAQSLSETFIPEIGVNVGPDMGNSALAPTTPPPLDRSTSYTVPSPMASEPAMPPAGPTPVPPSTVRRDEADPLAASIQAFVALARSYGEHGDMDKAIAHYRNALSLDPKNHDIHQELTLVLAQQHPQKLGE